MSDLHERRKPNLFSVKNTSTEDVPPFGAMALALDPTGTPCQEVINGNVIWHIKKPDVEAASIWPTSRIFFNRAVPIPPGRIGVGIRSWPARALLETDATFVDGVSVGLIKDQWYLGENGRTFDLVSQDQVDDAASDALDLGWVTPLPDNQIIFELLAAYTQFSTTPVLALVRTWDKTANSNLGGYTADCSGGLQIKVWDADEVGYEAGDTGIGRCVIKNYISGYWIGHIKELCCPGDEQGDC